MQNHHLGPWLFGDFSIADAMFAPIVSRFKTYQVKTEGFEKDYMDFVLENKHLKMWVESASQESEIIPNAEK